MSRALLIPTLVALLLGLALALWLGATPRFPDADDYLAIARSLRAGDGFVNPTGLRASRAPLLPFVVAVWPTLPAARLFGVLCFAGTVWWTGRWLGRTLDPGAGRLVAWLCALHPLLLVFSALLLTEAPFTLFWLVCLERLSRFSRMGTPGTAAGAGLAWGLACLTRPSALVLAPWALAHLWRRPAGRKALLAWGLIPLCAGLLVLPWTVRNRVVLGAWVPVTAKAGSDLYEVNGPHADGGPKRDAIVWPEEIYGLSEVEADRLLGRRARAWMAAHPAAVAALAVRKQARFWSPAPNAPGLQRPALVWPARLFFVPWLGAAALGAVVVVRKGRRGRELLVPIALLAGAHAIFMGSIRYRVPLEPLLAMLVVYGWRAWRPPAPEDGRETAARSG